MPNRIKFGISGGIIPERKKKVKSKINLYLTFFGPEIQIICIKGTYVILRKRNMGKTYRHAKKGASDKIRFTYLYSLCIHYDEHNIEALQKEGMTMGGDVRLANICLA